MSAPVPAPASSQFTGEELGVTSLTPADLRSAALTVCDNARDAADARRLLEACGLAAYEHGRFVSYAYGRSTRS